tara:strand:+ start:2373 stop:2546 length:174 start_codon:yes stop_codon:yes gene_type:complete
MPPVVPSLALTIAMTLIVALTIAHLYDACAACPAAAMMVPAIVPAEKFGRALLVGLS